MMPSGGNPAADWASREKPTHYRYLWDFRVEQCPYFPNYKCNHHKPYTCFFWHFPNQRRRRPVLKADGTFNYSPDVYCVHYDEITGVCPARDDCPYLHRTLGDTERRYHPRYYKTVMCVHDVSAQGYCIKNGSHCAFAHGSQDLRSPVYGIVECQMPEYDTRSLWVLPQDAADVVGWVSSVYDNSSWNDLGFVLFNYKAVPCARPPHLGLCRLGLTCPNYHDRRDRRRAPLRYRYSSTPCPCVRQGTEWNDTENCKDGDQCIFCHSRTEQKFHPDIYKSTMCNDLQRTSYCPRGPFCSFAHSEKEIQLVKDLSIRCSLPYNFSQGCTKSNFRRNDALTFGTCSDMDRTVVPYSFEKAPGSGRALAEPVASNIEEEQKDIVEVVTSVVTRVLSCVDLSTESTGLTLKTDRVVPSSFLPQWAGAGSSSTSTTDYCSLVKNCASLWDPSGIWSDQSLCPPKSCVMCAAWKKEAKASARREQIAEEEKREALARLMELEKKLDDVMHSRSRSVSRQMEDKSHDPWDSCASRRNAN